MRQLHCASPALLCKYDAGETRLGARRCPNRWRSDSEYGWGGGIRRWLNDVWATRCSSDRRPQVDKPVCTWRKLFDMSLSIWLWFGLLATRSTMSVESYPVCCPMLAHTSYMTSGVSSQTWTSLCPSHINPLKPHVPLTLIMWRLTYRVDFDGYE